MASAIGDDDTVIGTQLAAMVVVQGPPHDVGHGSSGFLDDQGSGGVSHLLAVISPGRHAEIDFRLAPCATIPYLAWLSILTGGVTIPATAPRSQRRLHARCGLTLPTRKSGEPRDRFSG